MAKTRPDLNENTITEPGNYNTFVNYLIKDPQEIVLTPEKVNIMHMLIGILGEQNELRKCLSNIQAAPNGLKEHTANFVEELGDMLFYCEGMKTSVFKLLAETGNEDVEESYGNLLSRHIAAHGVLGGNYSKLSIPGFTVSSALNLVHSRIDYANELLLETVKRFVFYGEDATKEKPNKPSVVHLDQLLELTACIEANILVMCASTSLPIQAVQVENFRKLFEKRYKNGYSDKAASERADKDGVEDEVGEKIVPMGQ